METLVTKSIHHAIMTYTHCNISGQVVTEFEPQSSNWLHEAFALACNQFEETTLVKLGVLRYKELSHSQLLLSVILKETSRDCSFQCREQAKVRRTHNKAHTRSNSSLQTDSRGWNNKPIAPILPHQTLDVTSKTMIRCNNFLHRGHRVLSRWLLQTDCKLPKKVSMTDEIFWKVYKLWCHNT